MTTLTRSTPTSRQPWSGSLSTQATSQTPPSPVGEMRANWPNGSDTSPTGGHYSTPRTMGPGTNPTPSSYSPPSTSLTTPLPRASPDGSSMPSPAPQPPSTLFTWPPTPPSTGDYTWNSSATESSTRRPRLSMIASATSRQRFREFWLTSGLPLDVSREPEPQLAWDTSDSEPEAFESQRGLGGDAQEHRG